MGHIKKKLSDYANAGTLRLHMPGHKGKTSPLDSTELPQTDDLNRPLGAYLKALDFLSKTYKSNRSFYLTCGATLGIQAMVLYAKKNGFKIIAMRNSHMSVINACLIFDADCEILEPEYDSIIGTYKSPSSVFIKYLEQTKTKCALFVTTPDYYGRCTDIKKLRSAADRRCTLIFCDQAHGAHFVYSKNLPESSVGYSDICVHGAHKTLGALTQGAYVHSSSNVDDDAFNRILTALNTSSPSHLIASSLEEAVIESSGGAWDKRTSECEKLRNNINSLKYIKCADLDWAQSAGYIEKDTTRIVIDAKDAGGGFYLYKRLYDDFNIQLEMADFRYAVAIMTIYDDEKCDDLFFEALKKLDIAKPEGEYPTLPTPPERIIPMQKAWSAKSKKIKIEAAVGEIAVDILGAYPPGTALVLPGEQIEAHHIDYFEQIKKRGGYMLGADAGLVAVVDI